MVIPDLRHIALREQLCELPSKLDVLESAAVTDRF